MKIRKTKNDILMSIAPVWIIEILNGRKTIEVRKMFPEDFVGWVYIYCTKDNNNLLHKNCANIWWVEDKDFQKKNKRLGIEQPPILNGKVVARFWCKKVEKIEWLESHYSKLDTGYCTDTLSNSQLLAKSRISEEGLQNYLYKNGFGYAIHISKLEIFDNPKNVNEFLKPDTPTYEETKVVLKDSHPNYSKKDFLYSQKLFHNIIERAPQSWCYAREA